MVSFFYLSTGPFNLKDFDPTQGTSLADWRRSNPRKLTYLQVAFGTSVLTLRKSSEYYTQVQLALRCTDRKWCDFVVWWPAGMHVIRVHADITTQKRIISSCEDAFYDVLLPTAILNRGLSHFTASNIVDVNEIVGFNRLRTGDVNASSDPGMYVGHPLSCTKCFSAFGQHQTSPCTVTWQAFTECTVHR